LPDSVSTNPAAFTAATKVEKDLLPLATSTMVLALAMLVLAGAAIGIAPPFCIPAQVGDGAIALEKTVAAKTAPLAITKVFKLKTFISFSFRLVVSLKFVPKHFDYYADGNYIKKVPDILNLFEIF